MLRLIAIVCLFALISCDSAQEHIDKYGVEEVCINGVIYYTFSVPDNYRVFTAKFTPDSKVVACKN